MRIKSAVVLEDPWLDAGTHDAAVAAAVAIGPPEDQPRVPAAEAVVERIPADEALDAAAADGRSLAEVEKDLQRAEARSRAVVLEMTGDIPDAEVAPDDTALFVARLNPVTTEADLDIIFSRFGKCKANIIRDHVTGEGLNFGFIEFETEAAVNEAFKKMNNVSGAHVAPMLLLLLLYRRCRASATVCCARRGDCALALPLLPHTATATTTTAHQVPTHLRRSLRCSSTTAGSKSTSRSLSRRRGPST